MFHNRSTTPAPKTRIELTPLETRETPAGLIATGAGSGDASFVNLVDADTGALVRSLEADPDSPAASRSRWAM
jgi:hypothetical protein